MKRRYLITLAVMSAVTVAVVSGFAFAHHHRQRQFAEAQRRVASLGGSLSFDLVDGNYMLALSGNSATDETVCSLLPTLQKLSTGFTLLGPGKSRLFWVTLADSSITEDGLVALSRLRISWLSIAKMRLTDTSVSSLLAIEGLSGIVLSDVQLSESGLARLRGANGRVLITINGETVNTP